MNWMGPANAWAAVWGLVVIWLGFLLGWGAAFMRIAYLKARFR